LREYYEKLEKNNILPFRSQNHVDIKANLLFYINHVILLYVKTAGMAIALVVGWKLTISCPGMEA
jgi:hypothetical protein